VGSVHGASGLAGWGWAQPTRDIQPRTETGEIPTPLPARWHTGDSRRPTVSCLERWRRGASLEPMKHIETDWVERGLPRQPTDSEEDGGGEVVIGGADERWPEWDFRSVSSRG
jgi:hypothetical protein